MKPLDPIKISQQAKQGLLKFYVRDGNIYCKDVVTSEQFGEVSTTSVKVGMVE